MPLERQGTVKFDPTIKAHREAAAAFFKRRAWGDSPIRFADDPSYGNVADQIEKKLLAFYMGKDKLNIPAPPHQALMVGTIIDGAIVPTYSESSKNVREICITKSAANDGKK